ncbi:MAG: DUF3987 domain-containing protein [Rhodocyclaceae bacterium]
MFNPHPFPLYALPPTMRAAVEEVVGLTQAPVEMVVSAALAAASLAVQAKFDVERMSGLISPCSLYLITLAESGERKTTVDNLLFSAFTEFEARFLDEASSDQSADSNEGSEA